MNTKKFTVLVAMVMVLGLMFSSVASATVISNTLEATFNVTEQQGNAALDAVNDADSTTEMQTALEDQDLGLDLTSYNQLTEGGRRQAVADFVLFVKGVNGNYVDVGEVQTAFDGGVTGETHKMQLIQLVNSEDPNTAVSQLTDIVTDLKTDSENFTTVFTQTEIDTYYGNGLYDNSLAAIGLYEEYLGFNDNKKLAVAANFIAKDYNGSFVTVMGYLQNAINFVLNDNTPVTVSNAERIYGDLWGSISAQPDEYVDVEIKFSENFHYTTGELMVSYWTKDDSGEYVEISAGDLKIRKDSTWDGAWTRIEDGKKVTNESGGYDFTEFEAGKTYATAINGNNGWASSTEVQPWWDALWAARDSGKGVWAKIEVIDDAGNYSSTYAPIAMEAPQEPENKLILTWSPSDFSGIVDAYTGQEETLGVTTALEEGIIYVDNVRFEIELSKQDTNGNWIAADVNDFEITKVNDNSDTEGINDTFVQEGAVLRGYWGPENGFTFTEETTTLMTVRFDNEGKYKVKIYATQIQ